MTTNSQRTSHLRAVLEFKSSTFTVPVLVLAENNLDVINEQLKIKIQQAPEFFKNSPIIIDLHRLTEQQLDIDLAGLTAMTHELGLQTIGIRGESERQKSQAVDLKIALLPDRRANEDIGPVKESKKITSPAPQEVEERENETILITHPIRSGQRVYSSGDLIVISPVSAGAEIMAEGNIHVYGTLRGRALAGVQGDENCRIFCSDLQAELVSIAGIFKISEDIDNSISGKPIQILFQDQKLHFQEL